VVAQVPLEIILLHLGGLLGLAELDWHHQLAAHQ
jgi:hypothetical protein